jgi:hypothetical protein
MSERRLLLPFLLLLFACRARAALEIDTRWQADSPEAIAAAVDAQAFQAALRRDVAQVYDAAGLPDMGVSAALQATILGGGTAPAPATTTTTAAATTTAAQTTPPPAYTTASASPAFTAAIAAGAVGVVGVAAVALFTANRGVTVTAPAARRGPELPYRIVRPRVN